MSFRWKHTTTGLIVAAIALTPTVASAMVARVGAGAACNYATVAAAVAAAGAGQTVYVATGTHAANLGTINKNLTIRSADANCQVVAGSSATLDAGGLGRVAFVDANKTVTFKDVSLINGSDANGGLLYAASGSTLILDHAYLFNGVASLGGGGVFASSSTVEMKNGSGVMDCTTTGGMNGGGVKLSGSSARLTMRDTSYIGAAVLFGNLASGNGGGVYMDLSTLEMFDASAIGSGLATLGGGVYSAGGTIILHGTSSIAHSLADSGGGVYMAGDGGTLTMHDDSSIAWNTADLWGGGVYVEATGAITLHDAAGVRDNTATAIQGGGAYLGIGATMTLNGASEVTDNDAGLDGGGLFVRDDAVFTSGPGTAIERNHAGQNGGGVYGDNGSVLSVAGLVDGNDAIDGGGLYAQSATVTLTGTTIASNSASLDGGGMFLTGLTVATGTNIHLDNNDASNYGGGARTTFGASLTLDGTCVSSVLGANTYCGELSGNVADAGGALAVTDESTVVVRRMAFLSNDATSVGSAIYANAGRTNPSLAHVENALFTGNSLTNSQSVVTAGTFSTFEAEHVTFVDNTGIPIRYVSGSSGYLRRSIVWDTLSIFIHATISLPAACTDFRNAVPANTSGANRISADPLFIGTARGSYRLPSAGSPAVNVCPAGLNVDLDGALRPFGGSRDMGAFEGGAPVP